MLFSPKMKKCVKTYVYVNDIKFRAHDNILFLKNGGKDVGVMFPQDWP